VLSAAVLTTALAAAWLLTSFDPLGHARDDFNRHEYRSALHAATEHLKRRPGDRKASLMAARCLTRLGHPRQAEPFYRDAGPLGLDDMQARAFAFVRANDPRAAGATYEELLAQWPDDPTALKRLAAVRMGLKQWKQVLPLADRLIKVPGAEVDGLTLAGIAHHELTHYARAAEASGRVLDLDPDLKVMPLPKALFWKNLAVDLMAEGRVEEARAHLKRALEGSTDGGLMELLGLSYQQQGNAAEAERCWRQAVEWEPGNADAWLGLGHLAISRRQWSEAIDLLSKAAELSPKAVEPLHNLAQAHQALGHTAEAERYRRRAAELRATRPPTGGMGALR
jgi:tetratricopeptide (TPR) repeat protein